MQIAHTKVGTSTHRRAVALILLIAGYCLVFGAKSAEAAYEQVDTFAGTPGQRFENANEWPEEVQLGGVGGMTVNYTGAGGIPKGTIYAAVYANTVPPVQIVRYNPDKTFSERWSFDGVLGGSPKFRCGPDGNLSEPTCAPNSSGGQRSLDVDVDQTTGNVYVLNQYVAEGGTMVHVFSPDGSTLLAEFGEKAAFGSLISETPTKNHFTREGGLAVDAEGTVYVFDVDNSFASRLMKFVPTTPGNYEQYKYAGKSSDIKRPSASKTPEKPVVDEAGDVYVSDYASGWLGKFDPDTPTAAPLCEAPFPAGSVQSFTVNPITGASFFYAFSDKKVHEMSPCDEETKTFTELGSFSVTPTRINIGAMAVDPTVQYEPGRPTGVLYLAAPDAEGTSAVEGKQEASLGFVFAPPMEIPPQVLSEAVSHVTPTTAQLSAEINPKNSPTRYSFQYLTTAEYEANEAGDRFAGASEAPVGGALLGEGGAPLTGGASLTGLSPDTSYMYRVIATSHCAVAEPEKLCEDVGADQQFRTFRLEIPGLPDNRAYELVSPVRKEGGAVFPIDPNGGGVGCSNCKPGAYFSAYPRRVASGGDEIAYEGFPFSESEGSVAANMYLAKRDPVSGWHSTNPTPGAVFTKLTYGYNAIDGSLGLAILKQTAGYPTLAAGSPVGYANLYSQTTGTPFGIEPLIAEAPPNRSTDKFTVEYEGSSADLSRVFFSANDALTPATGDAPAAIDGGELKDNLYEWHDGHLSLVNVLPGNAVTEPGAAFGAGSASAISEDGSRVFWSSESGQVYVREGGSQTREVPDNVGKFVQASTDGGKVLLSDGVLYDLDQETTTDLTEGKGGFQGLVGGGDDLSHLYFVATTVLDEAENGFGDKAQVGKFNLYASDGGAARYIATLGASDAADWGPRYLRPAEASPNGAYVAFLSASPLTSYDNQKSSLSSWNNPGCFNGACLEAFLYDSATDTLRCPSCNPTNQRPLGPSWLRVLHHAQPAFPQTQYLTDQGRLYFDSVDSLVTTDSNEGVEDVYQYEPEGVGGCNRGEGCVSLISSGSGPNDSNFLGIDSSGKNVFFTTPEQLVLKDKDHLTDLYVAREGGGIPSETEAGQSQCQGEACQPPPAPPIDVTPGSATLEGFGNVKESSKQKKHKKKRHKKHSKHKKHKHKKKHARKGSAKTDRGGRK